MEVDTSGNKVAGVSVVNTIIGLGLDGIATHDDLGVSFGNGVGVQVAGDEVNFGRKNRTSDEHEPCVVGNSLVGAGASHC